MKKFMAIVMCLAMALSMMTVVSFAAEDIIHVGAMEAINAEPGATAEIPVYVYNENGADVTVGIQEWYLDFSGDITIDNVTLVEGVLSVGEIGGSEDVLLDADAAQVACYTDSNKTFSGSAAIFTLKVVVPETEGTYAIDFVEPNSWSVLFNKDGEEQYENVVWDPIVINVKAPAVTTPTVEATPVDAADEDGQPVALYILQPKNAKAYGIKYVGTNEEYKDAKFASLAPATDAMAAVKVIGLDDAFEAYAE